MTDLVQDLDYVLWGDKFEAIDKSGISIDRPDADAIPNTLLQWHLRDSVDDIERQRNVEFFGFQGNRNPFVGH